MPKGIYENRSHVADDWRTAAARLNQAARRLEETTTEPTWRPNAMAQAGWDDLTDAAQRLQQLLAKRPASLDQAAKHRPRTGADPVTGGKRRPAKDDGAPV